MQHIKIKKLALIVAMIARLDTAYASEYFDPNLLQSINGGATIADTSLLSQGHQPPGIYRVRIELNGKAVLVSSVSFQLNKEKQLAPCLTYELYKKLGVDMSKLKSEKEDNGLNKTCIPMEEQVPDSKVEFDFSTLKLNIALPQTALIDESVQGIAPEEWDDGIPALISQYQLSGQQYISHSADTSDSVFANLSNGINIGRWRYRNTASMSNDTGWQTISNYVETAVRSLKGELTLGDASTPSDVFDSLMVRGVQLSSDDDMLPDQLTGFAPVVRGIAKSNAQVTIRDNGYIIYQRSLPPGPFVISDLSSVSSGGKLDVTITEADGSETHSTVAYSQVPQLLRSGQFRYSVAAGNYLSNEDAVFNDPEITQLTLSYGLPLNTTAYGGVQYQERFKAFSTGIGFDLHQAGAIAFDNTHSQAQRDKSQEFTGDMLRLTWHNSIPESDTQIQLDTRYYRHEYLSLSDWANTDNIFEDSRKRREYNLTVNQGLFDDNSIYATLSRTENADNSVSRSWQLGWNGSVKMASFSLAFSMTRNEGVADWDKQLALTLSIPLGSLFPVSQPMINYTATSGLSGDLTQQAGVSGKVGERQDLNWNSQVGWTSQHGQTDTQNGSIGLDYQGRYGDMNATYNSDIHQYVSWNASGSVIAHPHGITAGRYSNGSMAVVAIPGAPDVSLTGGQNLTTDWRGYAIVPDLQSYQRNNLTIDTKASKETDFTHTSAQVIPTKDAIVFAQFSAISGRKVVMNVRYKGDVLPFGARGHLEGNDDQFYVGDLGQVYINSAPDSGKVTFRWGSNNTCFVPFTLPPKNTVKLLISVLDVECIQ